MQHLEKSHQLLSMCDWTTANQIINPTITDGLTHGLSSCRTNQWTQLMDVRTVGHRLFLGRLHATIKEVMIDLLHRFLR